MGLIMNDEAKYFVYPEGDYLGGFSGVEPPEGSIEVADAPPHGLCRWVDGAWVMPVSLLAGQVTDAIQAHLDDAARALGYDDIKSAVTYAEEPAVPKFQQEGQAFRAWRSLVWAHCYGVLEAVQAGERGIPSVEELLAELPQLSLPT